VACGAFGSVVAEPRLVIRGARGGGEVVRAPLADLRAAWRRALPFSREEAAR
jgi:hypothetical protein